MNSWIFITLENLTANLLLRDYGTLNFYGGISMKKFDAKKQVNEVVLFKCITCGFEENILKEVVDFFDIMDGGDPLLPPRFDCQKCSGKIQPVFYVGHDGILYKI